MPDFDKITKKETSPEQQISISSTFNFLSAIISLILTIILHILYTGKEGTPIIIYVVIGFLTANFFWQAQAFWRVRQLKKQLPKRKSPTEIDEKKLDSPFSTDKLLPQADFNDFVQASVIEDSTKNLKQKVESS